MANPAKLTVTPLTVNGNALRGAGDAIDTNGTVPVRPLTMAVRWAGC